MSTSKPYRLLNDPDFVDKFNAAFAAMGLEVSDYFEPGNAYAPALVKFRKASDPSVNIVVQFDRAWLDDGRSFEDSRVSLKFDSLVVAEIDIAALLRTKLSTSLTEYIIGELATEGRNAT